MPRAIVAVTGAALALTLAAVPAAMAKHGADDPAGDDRGGARAAADDVRVRGACTLSSTAKLKLSPEDGRVEVEFEVDENRNGSRWGVALTRNGTRVVSRAAVTRAPSGSFEARAVIGGTAPSQVRAQVERHRARLG